MRKFLARVNTEKWSTNELPINCKKFYKIKKGIFWNVLLYINHFDHFSDKNKDI